MQMNQQKAFALRGDILWSATPQTLSTKEDAYLICEDGKVVGVFEQLPQQFAGISVKNYTGKLVIPGLTDLHVHAPQYTFRGLGMDLELLDWLETNTFPEEARYADLAYAKLAYEMFVKDLCNGATTRSCIFATQHVEATLELMELLETAGLCAYVGKVNMDRNSPEYYVESTEKSLEDTEAWLTKAIGRFENVKPILTPRFIPTCSDALMSGLAKLQRKFQLPMHSHLSENLSEINWVRELSPDSKSYGDAYDRFGMFGGEYPAIMAHCVHSDDAEIALMKQRGVFVAHCPQSNANLSSGVAPVRKYLDKGVPIGLGSDVAGGCNLSILRAIGDAVQYSKLRWRLSDQEMKALTLAEAFYLATKGGGAFFGQVGAFEEGYLFDAVVLDDSNLPSPRKLAPEQRLERVIYLGGDQNVAEKFVGGKQISRR